MLAVSACWIVYSVGSHYETCRADGSGKLGCFILALFVGWSEALVFVFVTTFKLLMLILP